MGQRSLLVIGYKTYEGRKDPENVTNHRIARHFQWNYGHFMILRAAQVAELMATTQADRYYWMDAPSHATGATVTFCVNRTTGNVQGFHRMADESAQPIANHDNNNGAFLLDIGPEGEWSFGFLIGHEDGGDLETIATASEYLIAARDTPEWLRSQGENDRADAVERALTTLQEFERGGHAMNQATADRLALPVASDGKQSALI